MPKGKRPKGVTNAETRRQGIMRRIGQRLDTDLRKSGPLFARIEQSPGVDIKTSNAVVIDHIMPLTVGLDAWANSDNMIALDILPVDPEVRRSLNAVIQGVNNDIARALALPPEMLGIDRSTRPDMSVLSTPFGDMPIMTDERLGPGEFSIGYTTQLDPPANPGTAARIIPVALEEETRNPFEVKPGPRPLILDDDQ